MTQNWPHFGYFPGLCMRRVISFRCFFSPLRSSLAPTSPPLIRDRRHSNRCQLPSRIVPLALVTDKILREKSYDVKVCLRDVFNEQLITDESFLIRGGEEELSRVTNAEGCLFWTEKVKFNYLAHETFGTLTRKIVGRGIHGGVVEIPLGIDPWKASVEGFADLRTRSISGVVSAEQTRDAWEGRGKFVPVAQLKGDTTYESNLVLKRADVSFRDQKTGLSPQVVFDVNLTPSILHRDIGGGYEEETGLQRGRFRLEMTLIELALDSGKRTLIAKNDGIEETIAQGQLVMPSVALELITVPKADFSRAERNRFRWEIYLKLTPVGQGLDGLMPAEGVLSYQPGQISGPVAPLKAGSIETLIANSAPKDGSRATLKPRLLLRDFSFEFKWRAFEIDKYLELNQIRDYEMIFTPELYYPFTFQTGAERRETLKTGDRFRFGFVFLAGMPDTEEKNGGRRFLSRFDSDVVVSADGRIHVDVPMRLRFSEEPYLDAVTSIVVELKADDSDTYLPTTTYRQFEARTPSGGKFFLNPREQSLDDLTSELVPREMQVLKSSYGEPSLHAQLSKPILPWQKEPMDLFLSAMRGRFPGLVRIDVDEDAPKDPRFASLQMSRDFCRDLILSGGYSTPKRVPGKPAPIVAIPQPEPPKLTRWERFKSFFGWKKVVPKPEVPPLPVKIPEIEVPWFPGYEVHDVRIVDSLNRQPLSPQIRNLQWQMTASFYRAKDTFSRDTESRAKSRSWEGGVMGYVNAGAEAEGGFKLFGNGTTAHVAAGVEGRYGWMHRNQSSEITDLGVELADREAITAGELTILYGEERSFQLDMMVRDCLLLAPGADDLSRIPLLLCAKRHVIAPEAWYYMADFDFTHPQLVDHKDLRERSLMKLIRGKRSFDSFREMVTGRARRFEIRSAAPLAEGVSTLLDEAFFRRDQPLSFFQEGGIFPGILSIEAPRQEAPEPVK